MLIVRERENGTDGHVRVKHQACSRLWLFARRARHARSLCTYRERIAGYRP